MGRAGRAFEFWYGDQILTVPGVAAEVQEDFLEGNLFHRQLTHHYGTVLENSELGDGSGIEEDPFAARWAAEPIDREVLALLALDHPGALEGWHLLRSQPSAGGVSLRWRAADDRDLVMLLRIDPERTEPSFRDAGSITLSYMRGLEGSLTTQADFIPLFDALSLLVSEREADWVELLGRADVSG